MTLGRSTGVDKADPAVEDELRRLPRMRIVDLRARYRELFRAEPPKAFGPDLLRHSIAYRIQECAYGGLSREHRRLLDQLVKAARGDPGSLVAFGLYACGKVPSEPLSVSPRR